MNKTPAASRRRRLGQNFLRDEAVVAAILAAVDPKDGDAIVEIGSGDGALTLGLSRSPARLLCMEIDRDLAQKLRRRFGDKITLMVGDVLRQNLPAVFGEFAAAEDSCAENNFSAGGKARVAGNLPYNISAPLLLKLSRAAGQIQDMHIMLQKEVAERVCAAVGAAEYGRLSVCLQATFDVRILFYVPARCFVPPPKVESAFLQLRPKKPPPSLPPLLPRLLRTAFQSRRKTLENGLKGFAVDWAEAGVDKKLRPQNLSAAEFIALARHIANR